jgi:hypothetical protein
MTTSLLDPAIVAFVFAPLLACVALLLTFWWTRIHHADASLDAPASLLASAVRTMPAVQRDWGAAMLSELSAVPGASARWRFAFGCTRVALLPPRAETTRSAGERRPVFGLLALALPPLALPFLYTVAAIFETVGGSPYTSASPWADSVVAMVFVRMLVMFTLGCLVAGVPLGLAGWWRRERLPHLAVWGVVMSAVTLGYFLAVMRLIAGGE